MPNVVNLKAIQSEKATYRFTYESDFFEHKDNSLVSGGKLDVLLDVVENKAENVFNVHLSIDGYVVTQCDRCLAELKCPVHTQPDVQVKFGDENDDDEDIVIVNEREGMLEVDNLVYDYAVLSIPIHSIHPEGECDEAMMQRLNQFLVDQE